MISDLYFRCKRLKCFENISPDARKELLAQFNLMASKDEQDSHLTGLISFGNVGRKRPRNPPESRKDHAVVYHYKIRWAGKDVPVCLKAFLAIHGVTIARIHRLQNSLLYCGKSPKDGRGKHHNREHKYPNCIVDLIKHHIKSFAARKSHYSLKDNPNRKYLPENLNVSKMHNMFIDKYRIRISYKIYWKIFHEEFNIKFGYPRSDTCSFCDSIQQKLNDPKQSAEEIAKLRTEKELHLKKAEAFRTKKKIYAKQAKEGAILCLSFDFMQNLPLPHLQTNQVFYSRQLWYNVFGVHNLGTNDVTMFTYHECDAKKGANEVTTLLFRYLRDLNGDLPEHLVLISDSCCGQNKNYIMLHFLFMLVHCFKMFKSVLHLFPVRGHSYLPNDQDFSLIEKKKRVLESAELPDDWDQIILEARKYPSPFKLHKIHHYDIIDMKGATEKYFWKAAKPPLKIKSARMVQIVNTDRYIRMRDTYNGCWRSSVVLKSKCIPNELELPMAYAESLEMNTNKKKSILNLVPYLQRIESREYYEKLCSSSNLKASGAEDSENDEENSSGCDN